VAYHINVDSSQNKALAERYNIHSIPSFVFVDQDGNEIDRIVGFLPPRDYLTEMTRIRNGINTVPDLVKRLEDDPENTDILMNLANKIEVMSGLKAAMSYWEILFEIDSASSYLHSLSGLKLALYHSQENNDPETLVSFVNNETNTRLLPTAYEALKNFYKRIGDKPAEAETYRRYIDFMSGIHQENSELLNAYAWRMTQLGLNLDNALERIKQAIELFSEKQSARDSAQIMDTKGEVLWKLGRTTEAVEVMEKCILLQPEDQYYQDQKIKFLAK